MDKHLILQIFGKRPPGNMHSMWGVYDIQESCKIPVEFCFPLRIVSELISR